jgi:hypothetical protein
MNVAILSCLYASVPLIDLIEGAVKETLKPSQLDPVSILHIGCD